MRCAILQFCKQSWRETVVGVSRRQIIPEIMSPAKDTVDDTVEKFEAGGVFN
jgi:hypothetical protein